LGQGKDLEFSGALNPCGKFPLQFNKGFTIEMELSGLRGKRSEREIKVL
jgi:hypothetical protein